MIRWMAFSAAVVVVTAAATVASNFLTPDPSSQTRVPTGQEKPAGPPGSAVVVEPLVHDFGHLAQQTKKSRDWNIENKGPGEVTLRLGAVTCSCTVPKLDKASGGQDSMTLGPGEKTTLTVSWDTKTFSNKYHQTADLLVMNDPEHEKYTFAIDGIVHQPVVFFPGGTTIDYARVTNDVPHTREVAFASFDRPETQITEARASNPDILETTTKPLSPDECKQLKVPKGTKLIVTLKPGAPLGSISEEIVVRTDHPQKPSLAFNVAGRLDGPISLTPSQFRLTDVSSKAGASQILTMTVRGRAETKFTVEKKPEKLDLRIEPMGSLGANSSRYQVTLTVPPGTPAGGVAGEIILKTDHPQAVEVKIRVDVLVHAS